MMHESVYRSGAHPRRKASLVFHRSTMNVRSDACAPCAAWNAQLSMSTTVRPFAMTASQVYGPIRRFSSASMPRAARPSCSVRS